MVILICKTYARVEPALSGERLSVKSVVTTPANENQADFGRKDTKIKAENTPQNSPKTAIILYIILYKYLMR